MIETYYQVTHKTSDGVQTHKRDTVERAYFIYKNIIGGDPSANVKLEEISPNGTVVLRGKGEYTIKDEPKPDVKEVGVTPKVTERPQSMFEAMFGITKEEYNECLANWNRLTGQNVELL